MSKRIQSSHCRFARKLRSAVSLAFVAVIVSGCSNFTRFDFPVFGLDDEQKTSSVPTGDVNRVYPPLNDNERAKRGSYYSSIYSSEPESYSDEDEENGSRTRTVRRTEQYDDNVYQTEKRHDPRFDAPVRNEGYEQERRQAARKSNYSSYDNEPDYRKKSSYTEGSSYTRKSDNGSIYGYDPRTTGSLVVRKGDTLYSLARKNKVSLSALKRANGLRDNTIHVGQQLVIPGAKKRKAKRYVQRTDKRRVNKPTQRYARYNGNSRRNDDLTYEEPLYEERVRRRKATRKQDGYNNRQRVERKRVARRSEYEERRREFKNWQRDRNRANRNENRVERTERKRPELKRITPTQRSGNTPKKHSVVREPEILNERSEAEAAERRARAVEDERKRAEKLAAIKRRKELEEKRAERERAESEEKRENLRVASRTESRQAETPIKMPRTSGRFRWPVRGRIISKFGTKRNGARNDGINFSVPYGTDVKAAESGVVAYAGNELKGYGNLVLIRHRDKWVSAYAHNSKILVRRGQRIRRGQIIAKAGKSGSVKQPQVHFELRKDAKPVDPLKYM